MSPPTRSIHARAARGSLSSTVLLSFFGALALAATAWWFAVKQPEDRRRAQENAAAATRVEQEAVQAKRRELFGEIITQPGFEFRSTGLGYRLLEPGTGSLPGPGATVQISYTGRLKDGRVFDQTRAPVEFRLNSLVPGMSAGIQMLRPGGRIELLVPPALGYGNRAVAGLPPGSGLIFEVTLVKIVN